MKALPSLISFSKVQMWKYLLVNNTKCTERHSDGKEVVDVIMVSHIMARWERPMKAIRIMIKCRNNQWGSSDLLVCHNPGSGENFNNLLDH